MSRQTARLDFAVAHPAAAGHFPGNPVIPGALILDAVIAAIQGPGAHPPVRLRAAKFLRIVRPGDTLELRWERSDADDLAFECRSGEAICATGRLAFGAPP